ncbi:MAG: hypothetical protein IKK46_04905 [Clostridia bacterium]|nr:hypothetical protein [Clostridia bacterium]
MKKVLSVLLATLMFLTLLMPLSVFAENGPYPTDWDNITAEEINNLENMSCIAMIDYFTGEVGIIYPATDYTKEISTWITYNEKTNTLTLNQWKSRSILFMAGMGDDFKIKLVGKNKLGCIASSDMSWGGSVTVTGNGHLTLNENFEHPVAVELDVSGTGKGFFKVGKNASLEAYGYTEAETKEKEPAIAVYGSAETDTSKTIIFEGKVEGEKSVAKEYNANTYETAMVYPVTNVRDYIKEHIWEKDGEIYVGTQVSFDTFDVAEVVFDQALNNYVLLPVKPENQNIGNYEFWPLDEDKIPETILSISEEPISMDVCIDENDKECVFRDFSNDCSKIEVYEVIEHETYGTLALLYNSKNTYKELKIVSTKIAYNHVNYSNPIKVHFDTELPATVKLKSAANAYGGIKVSWEPVANAVQYRVYRKDIEAGFGWEQLKTTTETSWLDQSVGEGNRYLYTVRAENTLGLGGYNKTGMGDTYIQAPSVKASVAENGIKVNWAKKPLSTGYEVYRSEYVNGKWSGWTKIATITSNKSTYTDTKIKPGTTYRYTVRNVLDANIKSGFKATSGVVFLKAPTVKIANAATGVKVSWSKVAGAKNYVIYRAEYRNGAWSDLGAVNVVGEVNSYVDKTAKTNTKYVYTVLAVNGDSVSTYKESQEMIYIAAPTVKIANASNGIKVSWSKVSGATGYTVYRSQYSGGKWSGWKNMGTAKADKSSWTDKSVKSGVQYRYTVRTVSGKSVSSFKATSGLVYLSTPTVKIANASTGVKVTWGKVAGAKNYIVYRSELSNGKWSGWKQISKVGAVTSTVDKTAKSGVYYKYTVKAVNGSSTGAYKASSQLLYLAQPTTKITNASNGIKVSWTKSTGSKGYTIYRSELKNGKWSSWKTMGTAAATKTSWVDKSAKAGVQYKYTVRAINGNVKSTYTATSGLIRLAQPAVKATLNENSIKVSWNKISGAKSYTVYRSELVDGKWTSWAIVSSQTALSFTDSAVTEGATYRYTVRAVNGKSLSSFVASANVIIPATQEDVAENVA